MAFCMPGSSRSSCTMTEVMAFSVTLTVTHHLTIWQFFRAISSLSEKSHIKRLIFYCFIVNILHSINQIFFLPSVVKSYAFICFCESLMISCLIIYNLNFHIPMYYKNEWFQKDQYKQNQTSIIIHVECLWPLQPYTNEKTTHTRYAYMYKQIHDVDDEWP